MCCRCGTAAADVAAADAAAAAAAAAARFLLCVGCWDIELRDLSLYQVCLRDRVRANVAGRRAS